MMDLSQVDAALRCLHDPATPHDKRREADLWLQQFRNTPDAWQMADRYLALNPAESAEMQLRVFFGAKTMAQKLATDFAQLPADILPSLQTTLLRHIGRLNELASSPASATAVKPSLRQLCIAFADYLLQAPGTDPRAAIQALCSHFQPPGGSLPLLEILRAMPEEASSRSINVDPARRRDYRNSLVDVGSQALTLLHQLLVDGASRADEGAVKAAFLAFGAWVNCLNLPSETVAASPMLHAALEATVKYPALFDAACSALQDVVETYRHPERDSALLTALLPALLGLEPLYDAAAKEGPTEDEDACLALSRLFADAGTTYVEYLCKPRPQPDADVDSQRRNFVRILVKAASHSSMQVSSATFRFWDSLADTLRAIVSGRSRYMMSALAGHGHAEALASAWRLHVVNTINPLMKDLALVLVNRLSFPDAEEWNDASEWTADRKDHFKHRYRYRCSDALLLCCEVSGYAPILQLLAQRLQDELGKYGAALARGASPTAGWEGVEACLYAIRAIARYVPDREAEVLPHVFALLRQLPPVEELRATCFRVVGRYGSWLRKNATHLGPALLLVMQHGLGLQPGQDAASGPGATGAGPHAMLPSPATECACRAISDISRGSGDGEDSNSSSNASLVRDELLTLASRAPIAALHGDNASHIVEALGNAIGSLTPPGMPYVPPGRETTDHATVIMAVASPLLARLKLFVEAPAQALEASAADGLLVSCFTASDGEISGQRCSEAGVDEGTASRLAAAARAQKGSIVPQLTSGAITRVEKACACCVLSLVAKLCNFSRNLRPDPIQLLDISGAAATLGGRSDYQAKQALRAMEDEVRAAAERGLRAGMMALQQAAWPILSEVMRIYGPGGAAAGAAGEGLSGKIVYEVEGVWHFGIDMCGPGMLAIVQGLVGMAQRHMEQAGASGHAPSYAYLGFTRTILRDAGRYISGFEGEAGPGTPTAPGTRIMPSFCGVINAASAAVTVAFDAAVATGATASAQAAATGRAAHHHAAPWSGISQSLELWFSVLVTTMHEMGEDGAGCLSSMQAGLRIATMVLPEYTPYLIPTALTFLCEACRLVDPRTLRGMAGKGDLGHGVAQMLLAPGTIAHVTTVLARCLSNPSHEPVVSSLGHGGAAGDTIAEVLRELALLAPEVTAQALDQVLQNPAAVPSASRPSDSQRRDAFGLMFPGLMSPQAAPGGRQLDKVGDRQRFMAAVERLSYAGVRGRLDDHDLHDDNGRDGFALRHRDGGGGDGESQAGDAGTDDEEEDPAYYND